MSAGWHIAVALAATLGAGEVLAQPAPARAADDEGAPADAAPADATVEDAPEIGGTVVRGLRLPRSVRDVPAAVTVLERGEIARSPRRLSDELVRTVPSAATFRRSSSLAADPSSQGVNLRGVGPSGVSRALVLVDGVPVNDPFGGWVYWRSLPPSAIERIEITPSGASALFGNVALGGVVQLVSRAPEARGAEASLSSGSRATHRGAVRVTDRLGGLGVALDADALDTAGHVVVAPADRGAVDGPAASRHVNVGLAVDGPVADRLRVRSHARLFGESLDAGTRFTTADVWLGRYGAGVTRAGERGTLEAQLFGGVQRFAQTRARVAMDRATAALAAEQEVPSSSVGGSMSWQSVALDGGVAGAHVLVLGLDALRVAGRSDEVLHPPEPTDASTVARSAGGEQRFVGAFVQDEVRLDAVRVTGALRIDGWRDLDGEQTRTTGDGEVMTTAVGSRGEVAVSPRLGVLWRPDEALGLRASAYRSFRAPTLNELYRSFQVGTILTEANPALAPERLVGVEAGPELVLGPAVARVMGFWNRIDDPIQNVTLAEPLPGGATRQRQNLGRARVAGLEVEASVRPSARWIATAGYTFVDATVVEAPGAEALVGRRLAQDPRHRATASLTFDDPAVATATASWRLVGGQFEDDLNTLPMARLQTVDVLVARRLGAGFRAFAIVENLFDREYLVGRAGVDTIGAPRTVEVGVAFAAE